MAIAVLAAPALAQADTYCVNKSGSECTTTGSDLQAALTAAQTHAGEDTVEIGPGTYNRTGGFSYSNGELLHIVGSGAGATALTADTGVSNVLSVTAAPDSTVGGFGVRIPATGSTATGIVAVSSSTPSGDELPLAVDSVSVTADPSAVAPVGVAPNDATLLHSTVDLPNIATGDGTAVRVDGSIPGGPILSYDTLRAHTGVATQFTTLENVDVTANRGVVAFGSTNCTSCLVRVIGANGIGIHADTSVQGINLSVNNDTIVGDGSSGSIGVFFDGAANGGNIFMWNSIVRGTETSVKAEGLGGGIEDYDDYPFGAASGITPGTHDVDVDPRFVNPTASPADPAADYRLRFDSPVIDRGDPNIGQSPRDLDGNARPSVAASTDLGAYEYQRRAPSVTAYAFALSPLLATFSAAGSDPDHGDTLSYTWSFDDGTTAAGQNVQHAFASAGAHSATVTVQDPTGLTASASTAVTVARLPFALPGHVFHGAGFRGRHTLRLDRHGDAIVSVFCPADSTPSCAGTVALTSAHKFVVTSAAKHKARVIRLGSKKFKVKPGKTAKLKIKIAKAGRKLISKRGKLSARITITSKDGAGQKKTKHATLVLKPFRRH